MNEELIIKIDGDVIELNGIPYKRMRESDEEYVGRSEIARMAGFKRMKGDKEVPNTSNLYPHKKWAPIYFPNFEIEKAGKGKKPWKRKEVRAWLDIPVKKRREMYEEYIKEKNDGFYEETGTV